MTKDDLRKKYYSETGMDAVVINQYTYPTELYFNWLEQEIIKLLDTHIVSDCYIKLDKANRRIKLLEACRMYDATGDNRPDGYIVLNYYTAKRQDSE